MGREYSLLRLHRTCLVKTSRYFLPPSFSFFVFTLWSGRRHSSEITLRKWGTGSVRVNSTEGAESGNPVRDVLHFIWNFVGRYVVTRPLRETLKMGFWELRFVLLFVCSGPIGWSFARAIFGVCVAVCSWVGANIADGDGADLRIGGGSK